MDMQLPLDHTNFVIDTIKYTELYPRDGSSGFNSSDSSCTTESALRKNLLEYEQMRSALVENGNSDNEELFETEEVIESEKLDDETEREDLPETPIVEDDPLVELVEEVEVVQDVGFFKDNVVYESKLPSLETLEGFADERPPTPLVKEEEEDIQPEDTTSGHVSGSDDVDNESEPEPIEKSIPIVETFVPKPMIVEEKIINKAPVAEYLEDNVLKPKPFTKDSDRYFKNEYLGKVLITDKRIHSPSPYNSDVQSFVNNSIERIAANNVHNFLPIANVGSKFAPEPKYIKNPNQNLKNAPFPTAAFDLNDSSGRISKQSQNQLFSTNNVNIYDKPPPTNTKQVVRYPSVLPTWSPPEIRRRITQHVPGILRRYNMDQWVAKIIWLYKNGDERNQKMEYRFRPERDVRTFDGLCDILSARLGLTRGVRYIYSLSGRPVLHLDQLRHEHSYVVSSTKKFKALNYGADSSSSSQSYDKRVSPIPPPPGRISLPPVGRRRKERSTRRTNSASKSTSRSKSPNPIPNTKQQQQQYLSVTPVEEIGLIKRNSPASEAEKLVNAVIGETHPVQRKIVRIINGENPSLQSQVLLNTRVSQEWEDLVRDLSLAVKFPKTLKCHLETLVGRKVLSYSQLRAELNAGNQTFYIYKNDENKTILKNSKSTNSQTIESLQNMKNLSLQDTRKEASNAINNLTPALKNTKSQIPLPNQQSNNISNINSIHVSRSGRRK